MAVGQIVADENGQYLVQTPNGTVWARTIEDAYAILAQFGATPYMAGSQPASPTTGAAPKKPSYLDQISSNLNDFNYGSPWEQQHYGELNAIKNSIESQTGGAWVRDGKSVLDPGPAPGALAQADAADAAARAQQGGYVSGFENTVNGAVGQYGNKLDALDAQNNATLDSYIAALSGINAPGFTAASSNPSDVNRQQTVFDQLQAAANGSLDAHANPEDIAHQNLALNKLLPLTDMQMTAQERFMMEQARQNQDMDIHGGMLAALRNLATRGQLGSGHEIGALLGMQQNTSQNRTLGDLGAEANAVDRAMKALGMYSGLSTDMRNAGFAEDNANMGRRAGAMTASGNMATSMRDASDVMARFNQAQAQQNGQFGADFNVRKAQGVADTSQRAIDSQTGRATGLVDRQTGAARDIFNAQSGLTGLDLTNAGNSYIRGRNAVTDANGVLQTAWSADENAKAVQATQPKQGLLSWLLGGILGS